MGVSLKTIIPKEEITFDELKGKKVAVDFSNMAYQFLASIRQPDGTPLQDSRGNITSHLQGILARVTNLLEKEIKVAFVFDGKPPVLKIKELEDRAHKKRIAEQKYQTAIDEEDLEGAYKYSKQTIKLTKQVKDESKELLEAMGLPCVQAPQEAEAQTAYMAKQGDVWAAASSDYDSLLFGCPHALRNLTLAQKRRLPGGKYVYTFLELMHLENIKKELEVNQEQLIAIGILTGTDFNRGGIKGIGPKKALKLVKEKRTINNIFKDLDCNFNPEEIYKVFTKMPVEKKYDLLWQQPDANRIYKLLVDQKEFNQERVEKFIKRLTKKEKAQKGLMDF